MFNIHMPKSILDKAIAAAVILSFVLSVGVMILGPQQIISPNKTYGIDTPQKPDMLIPSVYEAKIAGLTTFTYPDGRIVTLLNLSSSINATRTKITLGNGTNITYDGVGQPLWEYSLTYKDKCEVPFVFPGNFTELSVGETANLQYIFINGCDYVLGYSCPHQFAKNFPNKWYESYLPS
jgi:hypothetical protein